MHANIISTTGLILAAGKSTRFKSAKPKFLHQLLGKRVLDYVTEAVTPFVDNILYVLSPIHPPLQGQIIQKEQLGTGHAVMLALPQIKTDKVLIVFGDTPFITKDTMHKVCTSPYDLTITVFNTKDLSNPYGRVDPITHKITQYKEASPQQKQNTLCHAGVMMVTRAILDALLPKLSNQNTTGEYYLPDIVNLFKGDIGVIEGTEEEFMGIDNRYDLAMAEKLKNQALMKQHMLNGVTFHGLDSTHLGHDTQIAPDVEIGANVVFGPNVIIESNARILPFCYLENCIIRSHAVVGPFAHIRGGSELAESAKIGTFVEINRSYIGPQSKVMHQTYLGQAIVGENVTIGAGAITCTYNGKSNAEGKIKSTTTIQDGAFIGSNVNLIAPITVGASAFIGAGSTVSKDIEPNTLVIERSPEKRKNLE